MSVSFSPPDLPSYKRRMLTGRSLGVLVILAVLVGTELRFGWLESAAGAYLLSTNASRSESGAIWEQGHRSASARDALSRQLGRRQDVQREARRAASLGQVIAGIEDGRGAMISADHFLELYGKLPPVLSQTLASPYMLLEYSSGGRWQRTFFEPRNDGLAIYLLDGHSQVIRRLDVGPDLLEHIRRGEVAIQTGLDQLADFSGHIYPAGRFFSVLDTLPDAVREKAVAHPGDLLQISGKIRRVGISGESMGGAVDLGFEVETANGVKVILVQGETAAVQRLRWALGQPRVGAGGGRP
jgi:hypothetical protein